MASAVFHGVPLPPSANRMWRVGKGGVHKSEPYRAWLKNVGWEMLALTRMRQHAKPYRLTIDVNRKAAPRRDLDNFIKPINDLLQHAGIVANDSACAEVIARWRGDADPLSIIIETDPWGGENGNGETRKALVER